MRYTNRLVHDTDIVELELKSKKFSLNVRKREALKAAEPTIQVGYKCDARQHDALQGMVQAQLGMLGWHA